MTAARQGIWYAVGAYGLWGVLPVYWKALLSVPAPQILAHRIVWSFLFLVALLLWRGGGTKLLPSLNRRVLAVHLAAALLLSVNWLTYIWAVNAGHIVETSLGYFINPLVSVLLGVVVLRERLRPAQWAATGLAGVGVAYLTWQYGALPWIALTLAGSFALYGLIKKTAALGALDGLAVETAVLWLPAAAYLVNAETGHHALFGHTTWRVNLLLVLTGVVTALPLLLFASAARRVSLTTVGLLQYLAPSIQLLVGVLVYGETFDRSRWTGFSLIWCALAIYSAESVWRLRRATPAA